MSCIGCCLHHGPDLRWKDAVAWLAYPGVYLVYILARGAVSGLYPYPFVDVNVLGYAGVLDPGRDISAGIPGHGFAGGGSGPLDPAAPLSLAQTGAIWRESEGLAGVVWRSRDARQHRA